VVADSIKAMSAEKVKPIVVPGTQYKLIVFANRYLPWLANILINRNSRHFRVTD
jgi:hypothetical protein